MRVVEAFVGITETVPVNMPISAVELGQSGCRSLFWALHTDGNCCCCLILYLMH